MHALRIAAKLLLAGASAFALTAPVLSAALYVPVSGPVTGDDNTDDESDQRPRIVELVITGNTSEEPTIDNPLGPSRRNFRQKLLQIRDIAADDEIAGISLKIKSAPGWAKTYDLLDELRAAKAAGKKIICYTETLTRSDAMIASIADMIAVPPSGMIVLEGLTAELMYLKDMFSKLDLRFEVLHIGDFKTAYEDFSKNSMSDGQRATIESILDEYYGQLIAVMADNRGISKEAVESLFEGMFVDPSAAVEAGFIDAAIYKDEYDARIEKMFGGEIKLVKGYGDRTKEDIEKMLDSPFALFTLLPKLLNPPKVELPDEPYVAIVYASGAIVSGKSQSDFQGNVSQMGSDTIVEALESAGDDDNCKAVVLRVNSPGGSALASDMIYRAVKRVQEAGKPVVSSMGSVAASGGYWISMGCDAIIAQPSTITGSIGVVSMVPDASETLKMMGINVEVVTSGPHGDKMSILKNGPSDLLKDTITHWMETVYDDFIAKVAAGRKMDPDRVRQLAQGRAWTGRDAADNGLIDDLGGLQEALDLAAALGGVSPGGPLVEYPEVPNFLEQMEDAMDGLVHVATPVEELLAALGFDQLLDTARTAMTDVQVLSADRIQAVLPFQFVVR
jgi:protease-4